MGLSYSESVTADLHLYRPRHAKAPRPVRTGRSVHAWAGRRIAIIGTHVCDLGARLQLRREPHGRVWA